jgi:hypothetical protein
MINPLANPAGIGAARPPKKGVAAILKAVPNKLRSSARSESERGGSPASENDLTTPAAYELAWSCAVLMPFYTA